MLESIRIALTIAFMVCVSIILILFIRANLDYEHSFLCSLSTWIKYGYLKMTLNFCHGVDALKSKTRKPEDVFYSYEPKQENEALKHRELKLEQMKLQMNRRAEKKKAYKMKILK